MIPRDEGDEELLVFEGSLKAGLMAGAVWRGFGRDFH